MNYYIVSKEMFDSLDKNNIQFKASNADNSKSIVITSDTISNALETFNTISDLSDYTADNVGEFWGERLDVADFYTQQYIPALDQ